MDSIVIGIDLGTTNSCASYYIDGKLQILENCEGGRTTPSFIFFYENDSYIVGQYAKSAADQIPQNGIYEMKRLIGRDFQDRRVQDKLKYFPFSIGEVDGKPTVEIKIEKKIYRKTPRQLSSLVLEKIKADVDQRLASSITKAVITVPAYFNSLQRKETLEAAKQAGFTVLKLLNEPNAAALNFYHENKNHCQYLLVYDLGGGTFDVSILKRSKSNIEVLCVDGDSHLGGNDFDDIIVNFVCDELQKSYKWNDRADKRKMRRLNVKCEEAKKALSNAEKIDIFLETFIRGIDVVKISFSRTQLDDLIGGLLKRTLDVTKRCIKQSGIEKGDIEQVILAGGSTRMPKIRAMLSEYFGEGIVKKTINPDECVANGAALQAAMLSNDPRQKSEETEIIDVVPLSIGREDIGGCMDFFVKKNTQIPFGVTHKSTNLLDKQPNIASYIYEGERLDCRKNHKLGKFSVNITPSPPRACTVHITFSIDSSGILTITAEEKIGGNRKEATVDLYTRGIRSDSDVRTAIESAEENKAEDEEFRTYSERIAFLRRYCAAMNYNLTKKNLYASHPSPMQHCRVISDNLNGNKFYYNYQEIDFIVNELTEKCDFLVRENHFERMPTRNF